MGAAGRAIGPDGKLLKQQEVKNTKKGGVQQRNTGKSQNANHNRNNQRFGNRGPMHGDARPLMSGPGGAFARHMPGSMGRTMGGPISGPIGGPMGGPIGGPMGLQMRGPMGGQMGMGGPMNGPAGPGPMGMGGGPQGSLHLQAMRLFQGSAPDPTGSYGGFFQTKKTNDGGSGPAPSAAQQPPRKEVHPVAAVQPMKAQPTPLITSKQEPSPAVPHVGEVPGFGTNSSIHELFGKMVWRKMEQIRDQQVVDELQNKIMNLIHDSLASQNAPAIQGLNRGAFMQGGSRY